MKAPVVDAREIPVEWIVHEYQRYCGRGCPVKHVQESVLMPVDEDYATMVQASWPWSGWTSNLTPAQQWTSREVDCTANPLALGCDGLLVLLAGIFVVLVALKVGVRSIQHQ
jgi:hypothetical protein